MDLDRCIGMRTLFTKDNGSKEYKMEKDKFGKMEF
jgi:hypothetical protein